MLIAIDYSGIGILIGTASLAIGVLSWWLSKLLSDKKDITVLQVNVEDLERRVEELEEDIKVLQRRRS